MTVAYHTLYINSGVSLSMSPSLNKSGTRNPNPTNNTSRPWNTPHPSPDPILENNLAVLDDGGVTNNALYEYIGIGGGLALFFIVLCVTIFIRFRRRASYSIRARSENEVDQEKGGPKMVTQDHRMQSGADLSRDDRSKYENRVRREDGVEMQTCDCLRQISSILGELELEIMTEMLGSMTCTSQVVLQDQSQQDDRITAFCSYLDSPCSWKVRIHSSTALQNRVRVFTRTCSPFLGYTYCSFLHRQFSGS